MTSFQLDREELEGALVIRAQGRFDREAGEAVGELLGGCEGPVVLNLGKVDYISSSGVAALVKLSAQSGLRLASLADCVNDVLSLAGVARILSIHADEQAALDAR